MRVGDLAAEITRGKFPHLARMDILTMVKVCMFFHNTVIYSGTCNIPNWSVLLSSMQHNIVWFMQYILSVHIHALIQYIDIHLYVSCRCCYSWCFCGPSGWPAGRQDMLPRDQKRRSTTLSGPTQDGQQRRRPRHCKRWSTQVSHYYDNYPRCCENYASAHVFISITCAAMTSYESVRAAIPNYIMNIEIIEHSCFMKCCKHLSICMFSLGWMFVNIMYFMNFFADL